MKTISQILQLNTNEPIDECIVTFREVGDPQAPDNYGVKKQECRVYDATGEILLTFAGKNNNQDKSITGKTFSISSKPKKGGDRSLVGAKFYKDDKHNGKYNKIWVTDTAVMKEVAAPANLTPPPQQKQQQFQSTENAKDAAQRLAREYIQVREWVEPVFKEAGIECERELVTSILIGLERRNIPIKLEGDAIDWKSVLFNGKPIGSYNHEDLATFVAWAMRDTSDKYKPQKEALMAAKKELDFSNLATLTIVMNKKGITADAASIVCLRHSKDFAELTDSDAEELLRIPKFFEECEQKQKELNEQPANEMIEID